jgi:hypothetical protein
VGAHEGGDSSLNALLFDIIKWHVGSPRESAVDIKVLPMKKAVPIQERLDEIGRMLGGWMKSVRQR